MKLVNLILFFAFPFSASYAACDFDDFPIMDEMVVQSVMEDAVYNNRPMMVRTFTTDASYHEVVEYYHRVWDDQYDDTAFGIWHQITTMTRKCMMTVQVDGDENVATNGRLIISNPPTANPRAVVGEDIVSPPDSHVVSDLDTVDGPKHGRVTMLSSGESPSDVADFYVSEMPSKGWTLDSRFNEENAHVLVFRKGPNTNNIVIVPTGSGITQILINQEIIK